MTWGEVRIIFQHHQPRNVPTPPIPLAVAGAVRTGGGVIGVVLWPTAGVGAAVGVQQTTKCDTTVCIGEGMWDVPPTHSGGEVVVVLAELIQLDVVEGGAEGVRAAPTRAPHTITVFIRHHASVINQLMVVVMVVVVVIIIIIKPIPVVLVAVVAVQVALVVLVVVMVAVAVAHLPRIWPMLVLFILFFPHPAQETPLPIGFMPVECGDAGGGGVWKGVLGRSGDKFKTLPTRCMLCRVIL